jgi:hypothetical protein
MMSEEVDEMMNLAHERSESIIKNPSLLKKRFFIECRNATLQRNRTAHTHRRLKADVSNSLLWTPLRSRFPPSETNSRDNQQS